MAVTTGVILFAASAVQANAQEEFQEEQARIAASNRAETRARQRRKQVRERRIKVAQIEQAAASQGVTGSSGETGAIGSLSTSFALNEGFLRGEEALSRQLSSASRDFRKITRNTQIVSSLARAGGSIHQGMNQPNLEGAQTDIDDIFNDESLF